MSLVMLMADLPPISNRLQVESGSTVSPSAKAFKTVGAAKPLGNMNNVCRPVRVSSSTSASRLGGSETTSNVGPTEYGEVNPSLSGQDRHFLSLLESDEITDAQSDQMFSDYFNS